MIINKTLVTFAGRVPSPRYVPVGVVGDNLVECVEFRLPTIDTDQTATMLLKCKYADAITLMRTDAGTYCADITAQIAGESGRLEAYIRIDGAGGAVWNSEPFMLCVCNVPDISGDIEDQEPGALEQTLSAIAAHNASMKQHGEAMEEQTESASESAKNAAASAKRAEAAAERAENAGGSGGSGGVQTVNGKAPDDNGNVDVREVPEGAGSYQQLVTGADGVAKWEERECWRRERIVLKASPEFDLYAGETTGCYGGYRSKNPDQVEAARLIYEDASRSAQESGKWAVYVDGIYYERDAELPAQWRIRDDDRFVILQFSKAGYVYAWYNDKQDHVFEWVRHNSSEKKLDEDFLPSTVPVIQTAEAGQIITVKSVDENGKPTEWEATNTDKLKGDPGEPGKDGQDGKTAYQYAQDGGYTGTEAEFAAKLAEELPEPYTLPVATADRLGGVKVGNGLVMDGEALGVEPEDAYELIETITIEEENVSAFKRTAEPDGTPYNLSKCILRIKAEAGTQSGHLRTTFEKQRWVSFTVSSAVATGVRYSYVKGWVENGYIFADGSAASGSEYGQSTPVKAAYSRFMSKGNAIQYIAIDETAGQPIPVGSKIEIWVVRA